MMKKTKCLKSITKHFIELLKSGETLNQSIKKSGLTRFRAELLLKTDKSLAHLDVSSRGHKRKGDEDLFIELVRAGHIAAEAQRMSGVTPFRAYQYLRNDAELKNIADKNRRKFYANQTRLYGS